MPDKRNRHILPYRRLPDRQPEPDFVVTVEDLTIRRWDSPSWLTCDRCHVCQATSTEDGTTWCASKA